jgi:RNA polymerase sigma-70 factor (ECF subfamily)
MADDTLDNKDMLETPENFEDAYKAHSGSIYKFLFWRTKDKQVSEDLTSITFQKAWARRASFKGGSAQAWFYRIARNTLFDYWRKSKEISSSELPEELVDEHQSTSEIMDKELEIEAMEKALARLPNNMREIVRLRFIEGMSSKDVADKLNISDSNVRVMQYRALKKLREYLG